MHDNEIPKPRFTGIFIPVEVLSVKGLSPICIILLSWIDALYDKKYGGCWASNRFLAEKLDIKPNTLAKLLTDLRKLKFIEDVSFDGKIRVIKSSLNKRLMELESNPTVGEKSNPPIGEKSNHLLEKNPTNSKEESKVIKEEKESIKEKATRKVASSLSSLAPQNEFLKLGKEFKNVKIKAQELEKLRESLGDDKTKDWIDKLDEYLEQTGKAYKSHYATILKWSRAEKEKLKDDSGFAVARQRQSSKLAFESKKDTWEPKLIEVGGKKNGME